MNQRIPMINWQNSAQHAEVAEYGFAIVAQDEANAPAVARGGVDYNDAFLCSRSLGFRLAFPSSKSAFGPCSEAIGKSRPMRMRIFFNSGKNALESRSIITRSRGLAECVSPLSLWRLLSSWPLRAASTTTRILRQITQLCAPSVVPAQVPLLPARRAAAKPKGRSSAPWRAASLAAFPACLSATEHRQTVNLTPFPDRGHSDWTIRAARAGGPFAFHAACVTKRRGCHV